ncbi:hypothetical protein EDB80DRAFT_245558 [Ilyonectria destructans]|nr:hypothetical protein EDB80DRAFT_245558 [Ilyonectria destructans]
MDAEGSYNHHKLDRLFPRHMPHTLDNRHFVTPPVYSKTARLSPSESQEFFSGYTARHLDGKPKHACLHAERTQQTPPVISFDIDSILGFVDSPAAAVHGIRFYSAPQYCQNTHRYSPDLGSRGSRFGAAPTDSVTTERRATFHLREGRRRRIHHIPPDLSTFAMSQRLPSID